MGGVLTQVTLPMKISKITLQAFKAFPKPEEISIDSKNVLLYGENGSGKSSLYQALYQCLSQTNNHPNTRNIHADPNLTTEVKLHLDDSTTPPIALGDSSDFISKSFAASEFLTYKSLYAFHQFADNQNAEVFPIIQKEFFPIWDWKNTGISFATRWKQLYSQYQNLKNSIEDRREKTYQNQKRIFDVDFIIFQTELKNNLEQLLPQINKWYQTISQNQDPHLSIRFEYPNIPNVINIEQLSIQLALFTAHPSLPSPLTISNPHTYLNESRLTTFALAIRLANFEKRLTVSPLKIIVLDDLLLSLDMNRRMMVFEQILSNSAFQDYQKFIFTHDIELFSSLKKNIILHDSKGKNWKFIELYATTSPQKNPIIKTSADYLEQAEAEFNKHNYETAALYLRKHTEYLCQIYYNPQLHQLTNLKVLSNLAQSIQETNLVEQYKEQQYKIVKTLLAETKNQPINTDKPTPLEKAIRDHHAQEKTHKDNEAKLRKYAKLLDDLRERILNHGAHPNNAALFEWEIKGAITTIKEFETTILGIIKPQP